MSTTTTYYPRPVPVRARVTTTACTWTTRYGDTMTAAPGDVILSDERKSWTIKPDIFAATYAQLPDGTFVKTAPVTVELAQSDQTISTLEGPQHVPAGWAIVTAPTGERYSMSPERLNERYTTTPPTA